MRKTIGHLRRIAIAHGSTDYGNKVLPMAESPRFSKNFYCNMHDIFFTNPVLSVISGTLVPYYYVLRSYFLSDIVIFIRSFSECIGS